MTDTIKDNGRDSLGERFLQTVGGQIGKGVYVWGGNGELLDGMPDPIGWIRAHETSEQDAQRAIRFYQKRREAGITGVRAFDCSGLVYWALKTLGVLQHDVNSRGLYALCTPIDSTALRPGDLVFHHDGTRIVHVGVWADGGEQIECRGRDYGVVRNRRKAGYWNRFGRLEAIGNAVQKQVKIRGGSVRVREGDGTQTRCIGIAHKGETYPLLSRAPSGWYVIAWRGATAYITNKPQYTEVCDG